MSAQTEISALLERGTRLPKLPDYLRRSNLPGMAGMSIRAGLRAYFSTYRIAGVSNVLTQVSKSATGSESFRLESRPDYVEAYTEAILHFHFGIELAIKELLRQKHPLLASSSMPEGAVLLCRMLNNEQISFEDEENLKSTEFGEALKRVIALQKEGLLGGDLSIIVANEALLKGLNNLRNRIIHRGLFVMDYAAFDTVASAHIIPFLAKFLDLPQFQNQINERVLSDAISPWKHKILACRIDPIEQIVKLGADSESARKKLAYLKELGRAAFQNPLYTRESGKTFYAEDDSIAKCRTEDLAKRELSNPAPPFYAVAHKILSCPVCGLDTLVCYADTDGSDTEVTCTCCSFSINRSLGNASQYGLPIADFWLSEKN